MKEINTVSSNTLSNTHLLFKYYNVNHEKYLKRQKLIKTDYLFEERA